MCRARPSRVRIIRTRPPSRNPAASLRNHQPETAHPCRARQVAAPDRPGVPLVKPFVRPFKLLRRCSSYGSSRGSKLLPAAAEGHDTATAFFRPQRGAPSPLRSSAACLPIGALTQCARATVPLCTVSRHAPVTGIPSLALRPLAGASRRAQHILRRSKCTARAARRSAGLHSHAPTLEPDRGRSGGVSRPQAAAATKRALGEPEVHQ